LVVIAQCIEETTQALEALGSNLFAQLALDALGRLARGRQVVEGPMGKRDPLDPTYQSDTFKPVNTLARPSAASPQVRYWSLCIVLKDLHTEDCLRDEQVRFPAGSRRLPPSSPPPARASATPTAFSPAQSHFRSPSPTVTSCRAVRSSRWPFGVTTTSWAAMSGALNEQLSDPLVVVVGKMDALNDPFASPVIGPLSAPDGDRRTLTLGLMCPSPSAR
jgi:hypothetical protein